MTVQPVARLAWEESFIEALARLAMVKRAAQAAGVASGSVYARRAKSPAFAKLWDETLAQAKAVLRQRRICNSENAPSPIQWQRTFLDALAETSNVSAAAVRARMPAREVYRMRRENEDFARKWHAALVEGYEHLELELLARLRSGEPKDGPKFDNGSALRLLALHRDTMAQEHAQRRNMDVVSAQALIEQKLDELRQRVLARREAEGATIQ
jgi:hypothetical protein